MLGIVLGAIVTAGAAAGLDTTTLEALTPIDSIPTRGELEAVLGSGTPPSQQLEVLAATGSDTGVRLRAINALTQYCTAPTPCGGSGDPIHDTLAGIISANQAKQAGAELVVLRAAIESLGTLRIPEDISILSPLLNHPSRDIRAATARALGVLCNTAAINDLRVRYQNESTDQVKLAISATLRILGQPNGCPVN